MQSIFDSKDITSFDSTLTRVILEVQQLASKSEINFKRCLKQTQGARYAKPVPVICVHCTTVSQLNQKKLNLSHIGSRKGRNCGVKTSKIVLRSCDCGKKTFKRMQSSSAASFFARSAVFHCTDRRKGAEQARMRDLGFSTARNCVPVIEDLSNVNGAVHSP